MAIENSAASGGIIDRPKWKPVVVWGDDLIIEMSPHCLIGGYWLEDTESLSRTLGRGMAAPLSDDDGNIIGVSIKRWDKVVDALLSCRVAREYMRQMVEAKTPRHLVARKADRVRVAEMVLYNLTESEQGEP